MDTFSPQVQCLPGILTSAGALIKTALVRGVRVSVKDNQPGGSHHSVGTQADEASQAFILSRLRSTFPRARFVAEEECQGADLITNDNLARIREPGTVYVVDSLDGTAGAYRNRFDWSVVLNWMEDGIHRGGAIFAPDVRGGFLLVGEKGKGVLLRDRQRRRYQSAQVMERPRKKSTVLFGVDVLKRQYLLSFQHTVAKEVETAVVAGSCGLGVAMVAAGRAEAIVQPHQWPWDWASVTLIEAAGGTVQYYHYRDGALVPLAAPDLASYNRTDRTKEGGLGFIAGAPELVGWLWQELQQTWGR